MRLKADEIAIIKSIIYSFDEEAKIFLFGSRIDDGKRGGDIDLLIESQTIGLKEVVKIKARFEKLLGDRKIDIVLKRDDSFVRSIMQEAILL